MPLCVPHTDPTKPPTQTYRTIISPPLPNSKIRDLNQWLSGKSWDEIFDKTESNEKVKVFEESMNHKLNQCFPQKITKLGVGEEPFITSELKNLKRE